MHAMLFWPWHGMLDTTWWAWLSSEFCRYCYLGLGEIVPEKSRHLSSRAAFVRVWWPCYLWQSLSTYDRLVPLSLNSSSSKCAFCDDLDPGRGRRISNPIDCHEGHANSQRRQSFRFEHANTWLWLHCITNGDSRKTTTGRCNQHAKMSCKLESCGATKPALACNVRTDSRRGPGSVNENNPNDIFNNLGTTKRKSAKPKILQAWVLQIYHAHATYGNVYECIKVPNHLLSGRVNSLWHDFVLFLVFYAAYPSISHNLKPD